MLRTVATASLGAALLLAPHASAHPSDWNRDKRDVDTTYPYLGPAEPVGDWVNPTVQGDGRGFPRLVEAPAVKPSSANPTNNINVISLSYVPDGMHIHYQTPAGLGAAPTVYYGTSSCKLDNTATGTTHTYDRTPPCSELPVTQCSQFYHEVSIEKLKPGTKYFYTIAAANGTTASDVLSFTTARAPGDQTSFTIGIIADMGYTNAQGTYKYLNAEVVKDVEAIWHGGDISYADDWVSGILPCTDDWPICYNGTNSELPGPITDFYKTPLPEGEEPNQGGPLGGDMSVIYESNWDLWQQWMNNITAKVPYMVLPGNHDDSCVEFDGPNNEMTALLNHNETNSTAPKSQLTYYSCPPTQRNFTAYTHRFRMPGQESGGQGNFWYSFDMGGAHFISIDAETDYPNSPDWNFLEDVASGHPMPNQTESTDAGPFGKIDGNQVKNHTAYQQYQWLVEDLESVDRTVTPWIIAMGHRPMYSSSIASYQAKLRKAFEALFLNYGVDVYFSGHIHSYERLFPLGVNQTIDTSSIANNNTYYTNPGKSMTHIINGAAGNVESHSLLAPGKSPLNISAKIDTSHYGYGRLTVANSTTLTYQFIFGDDGSVGDEVTLIKRPFC